MNSLEEILKDLHERDEYKLEREKENLDQLYKRLPETITQVAELSGMIPQNVVRLAYHIAWLHAMKWYEVVSMLKSLYVFKQNSIDRLTEDNN